VSFQLDGTPALNLASFVTTFMDERAEQLMLENMNKNAIDAVSLLRVDVTLRQRLTVFPMYPVGRISGYD
jgi:hypothetical protein